MYELIIAWENTTGENGVSKWRMEEGAWEKWRQKGIEGQLWKQAAALSL